MRLGIVLISVSNAYYVYSVIRTKMVKIVEWDFILF